MAHSDFLYLQIADRIEDLIEKETWQIGQRLPSVRRLSQEQQVSMSTVFQAYYHLESKGLIEARPKSGYYVTEHPGRERSLPAAKAPDRPLEERTLGELISEVYRDLGREELVSLSVSAPAPSLLPLAKLRKSVQHALSNDAGVVYAPLQGVRSLRQQLARLAFNWGGVYGEEDIVVTAGCMEALAMCLKAVTVPGDAVAIESPTYFGIFQMLEGLGLKSIEMPTRPESGIDPVALQQTLDRYPSVRACLLIPNFNNPLGSRMPDDHKRQIVELLARRNVPLIEDDIYGELYFGKERPRTCKSFDHNGQVLYCSSLSKSLAPGYRIGWAIPGNWTDKVLENKFMHTVSTNTLLQEACAHFLMNGRYALHLRRLRKELHLNYLRYLQAIQEFFPPEVRVSRPAGGFVLWLELPPRTDAFVLFRKAKDAGISIAPGQLFSKQGAYPNFIRLSFGAPWDNKIERALRKLGDLLRSC